MLKDVFKVEYTGLRKAIGSPNSYEKNVMEGSFDKTYPLNIPVEETDQGRKALGKKSPDELLVGGFVLDKNANDPNTLKSVPDILA